MVDHHGRDVGLVRQEGAEEVYGAELDRAAQACPVALALVDQLPVVVGQVEAAGELLGGGVLAVAPVPGALLRREEVNRHGAPMGSGAARRRRIEVAVDRRPAHPEGLGDGLHGVLSRESYIWRASRTLSVVIARGRPPKRPRARAAESPAWVRSRTSSRSNSAKAPNMWKTSLPPDVECQ